jgi:hypothetical protein
MTNRPGTIRSVRVPTQIIRLTRLLVGCLALALAGCTSSSADSSTFTSARPSVVVTTTTTPPSGATVLPVGACSQTSGAPSNGPAWVPTELAGAVPASQTAELEFYSVGTETALGPRGWSCAQLTSADGSSSLAVYPTGQPNPITSVGPVASGAQVIWEEFDYTAHVPGVDLVCPYFPSFASSSEPCPNGIPAGEQVHRLTPDVVSITDPSGVKGSLDASGGPIPVSAVMIAPQAPNLPNGVDVAEESCSIQNSSLCPSILEDFTIREFPVPTYPPS